MKRSIGKVLVINSGSSSLKYQLFDMKTETRLAKGLVERIGCGGPADHAAALKLVVEQLGDAAILLILHLDISGNFFNDEHP